MPPIEAPTWTYDVEAPDDLRGYFRPRDLLPYFRGNIYGALAISWRLQNPASKAIADEHRAMSSATVDALDAWKSNFVT